MFLMPLIRSKASSYPVNGFTFISPLPTVYSVMSRPVRSKACLIVSRISGSSIMPRGITTSSRVAWIISVSPLRPNSSMLDARKEPRPADIGDSITSPPSFIPRPNALANKFLLETLVGTSVILLNTSSLPPKVGLP